MSSLPVNLLANLCNLGNLASALCAICCAPVPDKPALTNLCACAADTAKSSSLNAPPICDTDILYAIISADISSDIKLANIASSDMSSVEGKVPG